SSYRTGAVANRIIIQDGEGPWSGIWLNALNNSSGTDVYDLKLGDNVTVGGLIAEDFNVTRIDSITEITVNSSNNPLPQSQILETGTIGSATNNSVIGEQWESMIVSFENLTISDVNADGPPSNFGEFSITDGSGNVRVELQDGNHFYHNAWDGVNNFPDTIGIEENATIDKLTGYLYFSFSFYKLVPRYNTDFEGYQGVVSVENAPGLPDKYQLSQNYPNPFNPSTTISYSIPKEGNVVLKIYNVLGQEIKTLINQFQSAGNYKISFDASFLTSGIYFYSIRSDNFTQVKKMVLVK
ncbi:MAG TPA: T9SS type A sorting domain-containing protein, partial [Ignavibacteriaceae bacterium]|nr:T9SS type A sorting domain-containing protein [Ignavibacteriaceae bacterium]